MATTILSHQSSTGFYKAPVCKGILTTLFLTCAASHVPVISSHFRTYLSCEIPSFLLSTQIWRIVLNRLTFVDSKDFFCSALLLYYFRIFEKRMGSSKFASHLFGTCVLGTLIEVFALLYLTPSSNSDKLFLPPGLYSLLFPLFINYYLDVPRVPVTKFLNVIPVTGKTLTYLLGLQIASSSFDSFIAASSGLIAGILYRQKKLSFQKWLVIPKFVADFCSKYIGWIFVSSEPVVGQMGATVELQRQEQAERWEEQYLYNRAQDFHHNQGHRNPAGLRDGNQFVSDAIQPGFSNDIQRPRGFLERNLLFRREGRRLEPSSENVEILVQMGFDRARSIEALRNSNNDLSNATNILLQQN